MEKTIVMLGDTPCYKLEDGTFILASAKENKIEGNNTVIADPKAYKRFVSGGKRSSTERANIETMLVGLGDWFKSDFDSKTHEVEVQEQGGKTLMRFYSPTAFGNQETLAWVEVALTQHSKAHDLDAEKFFKNDIGNMCYKNSISYDTVGTKWNPTSAVSRYIYEQILQEKDLLTDGFYIVEVRASGIKIHWGEYSYTIKITKKTRPLF